MSVFACSAGVFQLFEDPVVEEEPILAVMKERIEKQQCYLSLQTTDYERKQSNLMRFLKKSSFDLEAALGQWERWVKFRREYKIDEISDEDIKYEIEENIINWKGKNKSNQLCCILTGRMHVAAHRMGTYSSFRKYLLRRVEEGMIASDQAESDKICIIYDRRGLDYPHIDTNLHQSCKKIIQQLKDFYSDRIGMIYVLHTNWIFWALYQMFFRPLSAVIPAFEKIILVESPEDLLEYFDEEELSLLSMEEEPSYLKYNNQDSTIRDE